MLQSFKLHTVTLSTEMLQIQKPSFETPLSRLQGTFQKRLKLTHKKLKIFQSTQNRSRSNTIQINMNKQIDNNIDIQYTNYVINSDQIQRKRRKSICNNQQITMIIDNSSKSNNKLAQKQSSKILKKIKTERTNIKIKKINRQKLENKSNSLNIGFGSNEGSEKQREKGGFPMSIIKQKYLQTRHHLLNDRSTQKPSKKIINPTAMYYSMYAVCNHIKQRVQIFKI